MIILFLIFAFAKAGSAIAQKTESEYRIDVSEVPQAAQEFIKDFQVENKIKWLKEEGDKGTSVEAKFKLDKSRYSIEFTTEGVLEDMEIIVPFSSLESSIRKNINTYLTAQFNYFKIEKVQEQYVQTAARILQWRAKEKRERVLNPKFEIVLKSRNSGDSSKRFEILFDEKGNFLQQEKIVKRSDNILRF